MAEMFDNTIKKDRVLLAAVESTEFVMTWSFPLTSLKS